MTATSAMTATKPTPAVSDQQRGRIDELGRIIMAYSEITERLQASHDQLTATVSRLQLELSEKNTLLERRNRLAALGEMAAGIAHEIRNPLGGIQLYAGMLHEDLAGAPAKQQLVGKMEMGVKRIESLVSQVLYFTREIEAHLTPTCVAEVVEEAITLAGQRPGAAQVDVEVEGPRRLEVLVDRTLLGQLLLNLLRNAVEACGGRGVVRIVYHKSTEPDGRLVLAVTDTGGGIPDDVIEKVFNPFFTTRDTGTGLGLSICHRIAEAHNGTITASNVTDETGRVTGAKFAVRM
ncbi:MAG: sensor histidine kinase [Phycisphaerae bacterium]